MIATAAPPDWTGLAIHLSPLLVGLGIVYWCGSRTLARILGEAERPRLPRAACRGSEDTDACWWRELQAQDSLDRELADYFEPLRQAYDLWRQAEDEVRLAYEEWDAHPDSPELWAAYRDALAVEQGLAERYAEAAS